jgi:hypothetical protein
VGGLLLVAFDGNVLLNLNSHTSLVNLITKLRAKYNPVPTPERERRARRKESRDERRKTRAVEARPARRRKVNDVGGAAVGVTERSDNKLIFALVSETERRGYATYMTAAWRSSTAALSTATATPRPRPKTVTVRARVCVRTIAAPANCSNFRTEPWRGGAAHGGAAAQEEGERGGIVSGGGGCCSAPRPSLSYPVMPIKHDEGGGGGGYIRVPLMSLKTLLPKLETRQRRARCAPSQRRELRRGRRFRPLRRAMRASQSGGSAVH